MPRFFRIFGQGLGAKRGSMRKNLVLGTLLCLWLAAAVPQVGFSQAANSGSWTKIYEGSNITYLFIQDDQNLWAVGENTTIFSSTDGGRTWQKRHEGGVAWLSDIFMYDHRTGWAVGSGGTILATADGGKTWAPQQGIGATDYNCVYFSDANHGFIGAGAGAILHTEDGGKKWTAQQFKFPAPAKTSAGGSPTTPPPPNAMRHLHFADSDHAMLLKDNDRVMISDNGGKNWRVSGFPEGFTFDELYVRGGSAWLAGGRKLASGTVIASLWYSVDAGKTWKPVNSAKPLIHSIDSLWFADEQNGMISVDGKLYRTTDGGVNWTVFYAAEDKVRRIFARDLNNIWAIIGGAIYRYAPATSAQANPSQ